ncbi:MAG: hypothetical protein ACO1OG_02715 [Devosia sp.]
MTAPSSVSNPDRQLTIFRTFKARRILMLDIVFIALGIGILIALGFYARAIGKL